MTTILLPSGQMAFVSDCDFDRISGLKWHINGTGYAQRAVGRTKQTMHRFILSAPDGVEVDHINGNRLDNRRENLRIGTRSQNQMNRGMNRNNTSGYKGVVKTRSGWAAQLRYLEQRKHLGNFSTKEAAARAYDKAAHAAEPEFAQLNFSDGIWSDEQLIEYQVLPNAPISGVIGVQPNGSGWSARLKVNGKNMYFGTFKTREEAAVAVSSAKAEHRTTTH